MEPVKQKSTEDETSATPTAGTSSSYSGSESESSSDETFDGLNLQEKVHDTGDTATQSKYVNDMSGWLNEVAHVEHSSGSGVSSGRSSKVPTEPLAGGNSSMATEMSSGLHIYTNSIQHKFSQSPMNVDPHFYNAAASFQDVANSGPPADPPNFPDATYLNAVRVNASVYNPETDEEIIVPNVLYALRPGEPPTRAYWIGRHIRNAIYGHVCACSILKARAGGRTDPQGNTLWEITSELAAVKIIDIEKLHKLKAKNHEDPLKEVAAMQFCSKDGPEPNLLECYDVYRDDDYVYTFMPYCSRGELFDWVKRNGRFDESIARYWFKQLLSALISLQKKGITHRDISLENILINENTHALVIDLGMCLRVPFKSPYGLRSLLLPKGRCGKRNYVSPEVLRNASPFDGFAIDIWAMGIVLFVMIVGIPPFEWASFDDPRFQIVTMGRLNELLAQWNRPISPLAADLLIAMLREDPRDRLTLFQVMNHPWVMAASTITKESLVNLKHRDSDDVMDCS